jgi:spermidine synthase
MTSTTAAGIRESPRGASVDLFLVSLLLLFLELACIRWFPAHVLYLTFFSNAMLLATFLGMSLGCLLADRPRNYLALTGPLLFVAMLAAQIVGAGRDALQTVLRVGNPLAPQFVFFGTEYSADDPTRIVIPIEVLAGFFFLAVALVMIGPGQELGRAFNRQGNRLRAYSLNIAGSLTGILLFAACSFWELSPVFWFAPVALAVGYFVFAAAPVRSRPDRWRLLPWVAPALLGVVVMAAQTSGAAGPGGSAGGGHFWSPYYRIDYDKDRRQISANLIGHQAMVSRNDHDNPSYAYALPYLLERDSGGPVFEDVLIVGAGSGNDISRALAWGARSVDAVEIDPVIQRIGRDDHPDRPYQDPRVQVHIGDGRNFLRVARKQYDLIVFALVDSLVLHSGYSNIRLESFMFTREAFADARARLKPGGLLVMYNYFRQGWIVDRLTHGLRETFLSDPLVLTLPYQDEILPETRGGFTILMSGNTTRLRDAFARGRYWLASGRAPSIESPNGFDVRVPDADRAGWIPFGPARLAPAGDTRNATDDWPFLYLREPMIPAVSARGVAIMGGLALLLFVVTTKPGVPFRFKAREKRPPGSFSGRMFFLGAAFMLVETRAVVHMALLFGSTWMVNTVVFAGVLVMILAANLFVSRVRPSSLAPFYAGLLIALAIDGFVPLDALLGWARGWQVAASCVLAFTPIAFAGVIFAVCFQRSTHPDRDFGANVAGALTGGLAENTSMLLGFQRLTLLIAALYLLSAWARRGERVSGKRSS